MLKERLEPSLEEHQPPGDQVWEPISSGPIWETKFGDHFPGGPVLGNQFLEDQFPGDPFWGPVSWGTSFLRTSFKGYQFLGDQLFWVPISGTSCGGGWDQFLVGPVSWGDLLLSLTTPSFAPLQIGEQCLLC